MKVLHAPVDMAGQAVILSSSLRDRGIESDVLVFNRHPFGYKGEKSLDLKMKGWIGGKAAALLSNFLRCLTGYDIFHFHFGLSLLPNNIDLPILKLLGKKVIMHYWGDDIRQNDIAARYTHLDIQELKAIYPNKKDDKIRGKIAKIENTINKSIVGDFSLKPYSPNSVVLKQAIDLSQWDFVGSTWKGDAIKIVHAPSNRQIKGTKYIQPVIDKLKKEGYNINFILLENMSNQQVKEHCKEADIIIDQLLLESYGIFAIECMALGKPVLCRIDEHFAKCYPDIPIVISDPDTLYNNLKILMDNPKLREDLGKRGRRFVEEVHDAKKIARQLDELYKGL